MEAWQIHRYDKPCLVPLSAQLDEDGQTVLLSAESNEYEIASTGVDGPRLLDSLLSMGDPNAQIWSDIKDGLALPWQQSLAKQLDELSLVQSKPADENVLNELGSLYERLVQNAAETLVKISGDRPDAYRKAISTFVRILDLSLPQADAFSVSDIPKVNGNGGDNFAIQTFFLQRIYVEENLPIIAPLWRQVLRMTGRRLGMTFADDGLSPPTQTTVICAGLYCTAHVETYLMCLVDLVHLATTEDCVRRIKIETSCDHVDTGLNFMRRAEQFALSGLTRLGESRFVKRINDDAAQFGPLVQGLFIEQYHVTQRFVEIIAPLMTKRTRSPVKQRAYRYFQEELGHEAFERATCVALGVGAEQLDAALPLPLFQAYVDAFTVLGRYDSIGYMSSIMVTEGMLGVDNPVHHRLEVLTSSKVDYQRVAKRHDDLNVELNHASLSRLFFEEVRAISPEAQERALASLAFLIELNFRAMDQAADFYGDQSDLTMCSLATYATALK
ncbi:hypothetical protein [Paraburkholderia silvatlantica]|uniref:Uncharacterized protein n=1 Tax=Paraburkholderia silvatlantica TaxID=321895 RepID=A0A2V4T6Y6_9BURK|nr:hypothetical protein [Paraburkholderia silvatlantica]PYE21305.1 hypothetical protein C7410_115148 [Paraburkholderia silvatlantica]TDQ86554.1 hypothetical protein C7412_11749 [Paraburkholderia silvatlantica]